MENKSAIGNKCIASDLSVLDTAGNEVLRENLKKCSGDDYETNKCLENIIFADSSVRFVPPSEYLMFKIIQQVEFMFSDANILKDKFLLKHMRRNKEGYVSLKLISSLRKVKTLSKDWRVVAYSLQKSEKLEMNSEMTKIKRIDPLPLPTALDASRTALVFYYLSSYCTYENVKKQLKRLGTVESLVILKSKTDVMNENVRKTLTLHEKIASFPFAVVTFETSRDSANAVFQTSDPSSVLRVLPLIDENEVAKPAASTAAEVKRCPAKTNDPSSRLPNGRSGLQSTGGINHDREKTSLPFVFKQEGTGYNRWLQRKNLISNSKEGIQKPFMVILRVPRGPDGTSGFRKRKAGLPTALSGS